MRDKTVRINLANYRCPDAISLFRRTVTEFLKSNCSELEVIAIEPSLARDVPYTLEHNSSWNLRLETSSAKLTQEHLEQLFDDPDEDIFDGIKEILFFKIVRLH
ncbi:hypothetical protein VIBNISOn1_1050014 [Vibrio nigripulchritudo SOn1]|uniref:Thioredoxin family protein n=1 Tax=Vibrio nigripulchritudo SOn1 TaxID=1238450 RepID=A0AAV2VHU1_9VIBR|nr:hypothetical protein [Vibrio nigripulchritudo]CCO44188.1 hypothetical protein VIBNISOn1_1050014 [Vibrio nigripulchritudo SOn1]